MLVSFTPIEIRIKLIIIILIQVDSSTLVARNKIHIVGENSEIGEVKNCIPRVLMGVVPCAAQGFSEIVNLKRNY